MSFTVAAFYRFVKIDDLPAMQTQVKEFCAARDIIGIILLAPEGVNSTIAGDADKLNETIDFLDSVLGIKSGELKFSTAENRPFRKLRVRLKKEIITMKRSDADPTEQVGKYVRPADWNALLQDPEVVLLDTRNTYEVELGTFENAIDPKIKTFSQFPDFVEKHLDPLKHKKIAMFCTGGIRCEKASSYMLAQGFEEVYHLQGGILKYIEETPAEQSKWDGTCFVFDRRVALDHGLAEDKTAQELTAANAAWPIR